MKKILSFVLAVAMVLAISVPAMAAETEIHEEVTSVPTDKEQTVCVQVVDENGIAIDEEDVDAVYSIQVDFDKLHFDFTADQEAEDLVWDAANKKYSNLTGTWSAAQSITVTNSSNKKVAVAAAFSNSSKTSATTKGVTAALSDADATLSAASEANPTALSTEYSVSVSGTPYILEHFVVDTVTVSLTAA